MLGQGQSDSAGKKDWWHGSAMPVLHPPREGRNCMAWPAGSSTNHHGGTQYHLDVQSPGGHCFLAFSKFRDHPSVWEDLGNWCMSYFFCYGLEWKTMGSHIQSVKLNYCKLNHEVSAHCAPYLNYECIFVGCPRFAFHEWGSIRNLCW